MCNFKKLKDYLDSLYPVSKALEEYLQASIIEKTFPKNHVLLSEGEIPKSMWFIVNGTARVHRYDNTNDDDHTLWYWRNELIIPFTGFYGRLPSQTSISLIQRSTVICLSYVHVKYLHELFPEYHFINQAILENTNSRLSQYLDLLQHQETAVRYQFLLDHHSQLLLHASLKHIASFLGMSISTIKHLRYG